MEIGSGYFSICMFAIFISFTDLFFELKRVNNMVLTVLTKFLIKKVNHVPLIFKLNFYRVFMTELSPT